MKTMLMVLCAIVFFGAGCNLNPTGTPTAALTPTLEPTPLADSSSSSVPMTTQVDKPSGIAFDYPTGWIIVAPPDKPAVAYSYSLASFDLLNPPAVQSKSQQGVPAGETEIQVNFHTADDTVDSIRRDLQTEAANGTAKILKEQVRTAPDGSTAYYYEIQGMFEGTGYLFQTRVNGRTVSVVAYGEGNHFEDVIKSLRAA